MLRFSAWIMLLALTACGEKPPERDPRPEWQGAAVDGISPLMTPQAVAKALRQRGYRQVACTQDRPVRADMLVRGDAPGCFESMDRPMRLRLNFFELKEGRRLAIVNFDERDAHVRTRQQRLDSSRNLARRLRRHWGKPLTMSQDARFVTLYWGRPGGSPSLPDLVSTTVSADLGASITMTSFWAYGEQRDPA
jgi:hypothetical protein